MRDPARVLVCVIVLLASPWWAPFVQAHPVTVDGDPGDWFARDSLAISNQGILAANAQREGEYVWQDAPSDERTDFASPDLEVDLLEFRVTASFDREFYFLARFADLTQASGNGTVQIQIAVDVDRTVGSGQTFLGGFSDTAVPPSAAWEYLIVTGLGSGRASPYVYDASFTDVDPGGSSAQAISVSQDCVEIAVPWDLLGGFPSLPLRFTVAVLRSDTTDTAWDVAGASDVLDALTNYGVPGSSANTWTEVGDGVLDHHFELWFSVPPGPDPLAPFLIREVLYDPSIDQLDREWVSIANKSGGLRSLEGYRIGDAEDPASAEGMRVFPAGAEILGRITVAQNAVDLQSVWPETPDFEWESTDPAVPDLLPASGWGQSSIELADEGDQLLLIDPYWTIIDVVSWEDGSFPNLTASGGAADGESIERDQLQDTDDCSLDFTVNPNPYPGYPTDAPPVGSGRMVLSQNVPNPFNPATTISFDLPRDGMVRLTVHDAKGRLVRTLVSGPRGAGPHTVRWSGEDDAGRPVASGVYLYRLVSEGQSVERSMLLLK